jgi:hypothetical protein
MPKLLFVDTNIYLDFYRIRNEVKTSFLDHLEGIKNNKRGRLLGQPRIFICSIV